MDPCLGFFSPKNMTHVYLGRDPGGTRMAKGVSGSSMDSQKAP